jgi:hypothetical protein
VKKWASPNEKNRTLFFSISEIHGRGGKAGRENDLVKIAKIVEITISSMRNFLNEEGVLHQNASLIIRITPRNN